MKYVYWLAFAFVLANWSFVPYQFNTKTPQPGKHAVRAETIDFINPCDSVTIFLQQLHTAPPSCCFQLILDNKLRNAITQIKLDISTATFKNITVVVNAGWIVSQTPQMDILLSHSSGFIPLGGASPLSFCLMGGNNPDSLKISFSYSAFGMAGTCNVNTLICSDPVPCDAAFSFQSNSSCGSFQFTNQSTGAAPLTYSWNFGDPGSGNNNTSTAQNPVHQFSKCGDFIVCLKTMSPGCVDSICKTIIFSDIVKPAITCPLNQNFQCTANTNPPATGVAAATDNCTPSNSIVITSSDVVSGTAPCDLSISRTWQAKDLCGNISTCVQSILVKDNVLPTITCPASTTVNTNPGTCIYTGTIPQPTALDNCDQVLDFTCSLITSGSSILITAQTQFPKGINSITCFAKDDCGNQSPNCNFTLTVKDIEPPAISCPGNMSVVGAINPQGQCKAVVNKLTPTVTDNCLMVSTTYSITGATTGTGNTDASGTNFMQGTSTVTYTATDMSGNSKSCSFTISVTCPKPKCDSVSASIAPQFFPASPFACLFGFTINNQASAISKVQVDLKTASFSGISVNAPFTGTFQAPDRITFTHVSGTIPIGSFLAAGFAITGGSNPDTAVVKFFYNNGLSTCDTNIIFNCPVPPPPKPKCDSISAFLVPFQALPYACTYQFHVINQATAISKIQIDLKTATFNSAGIVSPFSPVISPASRLTITHSSGSIPLGNFHVADLGINIGSNPDTAVVKFFYNNGLSSCDTNLIFNCPVDTTCGFSPSCATTSISLNTGVGANGQLLSPRSYDPNWMVTQSPYTGLSVPRPAEVIYKYISWNLQPNAIAPCSQWISCFQSATLPNSSSNYNPYTYTKCFCVCKDKAKVRIQLSAMADNSANFALYDANGNLVSQLLTINPVNTAQAFMLPADTSTTDLILNKGTYCIRVDVRNYANVTGINICGSVTGEGLIKTDCCEPNSFIAGHKYLDVTCSGQPLIGQLTLPGWQIVLCTSSGVAIDTVITDATGYYSFGPIPASNYIVKEINQPGWTLTNPLGNLVQVQLDTHDVQRVNFGNCPPTTCDSISFWVESLRTIPPACCFRLHIDNLVPNKFTQIPITLNSAFFNSISVDNLNGWFASQSNLSTIHLMFNANNNSFIPVGSFTPLSWCINGGSNPDTIDIKAEYLMGQSKVSCDTSFVFFCPPQPDTACGIGCKADSISLSTGVDHSTGQFYAPGSPDAYWTVVQSPYPLYILPKPAYVLATPTYWQDQPNSSMPCSKWINFSGGPYHYDDGLYEFTRCFCICKDGSALQIHLSALADNAVTFTLCDSTGTTIATLLPPKTSGSPFLNPPSDTTVQLILDKGKYCIKASVYNYGHTYTGLNVCGSIKGTGLVKEICCEPSSITGIKYLDTLCAGLPYNGQQQVLQGWQIVLCTNQGVALDTVTTDVNGAYSFSPLLPGLYIVKEINQSGWIPSLPASGMSSIYLGANQVAQVNFANCPPEIDSCCKSKSSFAQHIANAVQLTVLDSVCKGKINLRLPACDSALLINWGDGLVQQGPFANGMWMHTYTQSGTYIILVPIVEYGANGKPCFDTLLRFPIELHCTCECGRYTLTTSQNGFISPVQCNDTLILGCPPPPSLSINGHFNCAGDSCLTPDIHWTLTGSSISLSGNVASGNIQINIPMPLTAGNYTLNLSTVCGIQKCTCKVTIVQRPCAVTDTCVSLCSGTSWNQLNTSWIQDMVVYQGKLIAAGSFSSIGNPAIAASNIAAWNGSSWSPLGAGVNNIVNDIEVHNGILYAGGEFTIAGNTAANKIASWNGSSWAPLPQGGINGSVTNVDALLSSAWGLVVGGRFNSVGSPALIANNIARWNPGPGWATFGSGFNGPVFALSTFNGNIAAGGQFGNSPGGLNNLAIWASGFWNKVGGGGAVNINTVMPTSGDGIHAIASYNGILIVGGQFPSAVSTTVNNLNKTQNLAQWNGAYWTTLGIGPNPPGSSVNTGNGVYALKVINNELYVGGHFSQINNQNINLLAKWNGTTWSGLGHPSFGIVRAIALYSTKADSICNLYTGGEVLFNQWKCSAVSTVDPAHSIALSVFPNPANDKIYIHLNEVLKEDIHIGIYSLLGQKIWEQSYKPYSTETKTIDVRGFGSGTYVIKVSSLKGIGVKKIILAQ